MLTNMLAIAEVSVKKIQLALDHLKNLTPIDASKIENLSQTDMLYLELLIHRFAKLQDYLGRTVFGEVLKATKDDGLNMTMIDKVNVLEKIGILQSADLWDDMRKVRNHISHEYPDQPHVMATYLNQIITLSPKLLDIVVNIKAMQFS